MANRPTRWLAISGRTTGGRTSKCRSKSTGPRNDCHQWLGHETTAFEWITNKWLRDESRGTRKYAFEQCRAVGSHLPRRGCDRSGSRPASGNCIEPIDSRRTLFAPLWIDLSVKRARKLDRDPLTWRQLTVAEQRHILPRDVAVGYRMQCGPRQWVAYRSLAAPANRTFLGINLSTEFFVGQFDTDGETESIIEIE